MKLKKYLTVTICGIIFVLLLVLELFGEKIFTSPEQQKYIYPLISRVLAGAACLLFLCHWGMKGILLPSLTLKGLAVFLPCMAIAVNNFPFIPFFTGEAYVEKDISGILMYAALCLSVGFFEEMAFRGCIFTAILGRFDKRTFSVFLAIVLSSAVFGVIHLLNIINGASPAATLLQVGYSFLIGGMCSVILVKTQNIWYCVILHSVYNFAGGIVPEFGGGEAWTAAEIVLTAAVAVIVAVYVIYTLCHIRPEEISRLLGEKQGENSKEQTE